MLVLGIMDREINEKDELDLKMAHDLFGYSKKNQFKLVRPSEPARQEYFEAVVALIRKPPTEFPEPENRKKRKLAELPVAQVQEAPKGPTKAEDKAQKMKDRLTLNQLKMWIQRVMDHIKIKYKKFRTPVIDEATITYLYDEQDPNLVTTDLTEEQRQQQQLFRPYEIDKDAKGVPGLREVASGKFYYNLEIVTIEKRLSNGYYKRPKDFLADIKRLAKDANTSGDQDRTLKANEMLTNVEVDMADLQQQHPVLAAECEAVYQREQERERQRLLELREAERKGEDVPRIVPNVPPQNASTTTTEASGPIVLGQQVPGRPSLFPFTPSRLPGPGPVSNPWSTTNGSHPSHHTNGSTVPSRPQEDSEMLDSQPDPFYTVGSAGARPPVVGGWGPVGTPSQQNTQGQRSQKSAHTQIPHGSHLDQYQNSASTTTSGQKTSDKSNRSSGPYSVGSNGLHPTHPDFSNLAPMLGSQLPDTQEVPSSSSQSQPASQPSETAMAPPAPPQIHRQSSIIGLLNDPADGAQGPAAPKSLPPPPPPPMQTTLDEDSLALLRQAVVKNSSGMSVEQMEQVNACLMDVIWRSRGDWNRNHVIQSVNDAFNAAVGDIEKCQGIEGPSQEKRTVT